MTEIKSTVEINGKIYNMKSGEMLPVEPSVKIDDFKAKKIDVSHSISSQHKTNKAKINHVARHPAKSSTLVRSISRPSTQHVTSAHKPKHGEFLAKTGDSTTRSEMIKKFHNPVKKVHTQVAVKKPVVHAPPLTIQQLEDQFKTKIFDPFEEAMQDATSHIHELHNVEGPASRIVKIFHPFGSVARATLTSVIVVSTFAVGVYLTVPSVKLKMASLQASLPASLPNYQPAGFGIDGPIKAEPGKVTVNYKSNSDNSNYKLTQQASNWSSQALLNNQVLATAKPFQTYQQNGKTVYVYDNNNATWVDAGILYTVESNTTLSSDQLLKIAESL